MRLIMDAVPKPKAALYVQLMRSFALPASLVLGCGILLHTEE